jgi:hypothetical protein
MIVWSLFVRASSLQRKRAALTVAAIAWGTVAILLLLAFGEGLSRQMMKGRLGMGENLAVWWPGETSKVWQGLPTGRPIRPRIDDIEYLRGRLPDDDVIGEIDSYQTPFSWGRKSRNVHVVGTNAEYGEIRNHFAREGGRFFNLRDERRSGASFSATSCPEVFGELDPVGQVVDLRAAFLVIRVLESCRWATYGGPDARTPSSRSPPSRRLRARSSTIVIKVARRAHARGLERLRACRALPLRPTDKEVMGFDTPRARGSWTTSCSAWRSSSASSAG